MFHSFKPHQSSVALQGLVRITDLIKHTQQPALYNQLEPVKTLFTDHMKLLWDTETAVFRINACSNPETSPTTHSVLDKSLREEPDL